MSNISNNNNNNRKETLQKILNDIKLGIRSEIEPLVLTGLLGEHIEALKEYDLKQPASSSMSDKNNNNKNNNNNNNNNGNNNNNNNNTNYNNNNHNINNPPFITFSSINQ
ncbi:hypothetical protein ACTFIV_010397 [Dictyostelium citrinum]